MYKIKKAIKIMLSKYYLINITRALNKDKNAMLIKNNNLLDELHKKKNITCYVKDRKLYNDINISFIIPLYNSKKGK